MRSLRKIALMVSLLGSTSPTFAAYVQSALGNAVVNDASAAYYNPAGLILLKNPQFIGSMTYANIFSKFEGTATKPRFPNGLGTYTQSGTASSRSQYFLPTTFIAVPYNDKISFGLAEIYNNYAYTNYPYNSVIRYSQTYSFISTLDLVPAVGYKINDQVSVGLGLDYQIANISLQSMVGWPTSLPAGIRDIKSYNAGNAKAWGAHGGVIWQALKGTLLGLTYRTAVSYRFRGVSDFNSSPVVNTNQWNLKIVTPPSQIFTVVQYLNPQLNVFGTLERMEWSSVQNLNMQNVAVKIGSLPGRILPSSNLSYFLANTMRYTLGSNYLEADKKWSVRGSASYDRDPTNPTAQVAIGDNIILSLGGGYRVTKQVMFDLSYSHVWYKQLNINTSGGTNNIVGNTNGHRDIVVAKVIYDFV